MGDAWEVVTSERVSRSTLRVIIFPQSPRILSWREGPEGCCPLGREGGKEGGSLTHTGEQSGCISLHPRQRRRPIPRLHENPKAGHPRFLTPCPRCHSLDPPRPCTHSHLNEQAGNGPSQSLASAGCPGGGGVRGEEGVLLPPAWWTASFASEAKRKARAKRALTSSPALRPRVMPHAKAETISMHRSNACLPSSQRAMEPGTPILPGAATPRGSG